MKKQKKFVRLLLVILALSFSLSSFFACSKEEDEDATGTGEEVSTNTEGGDQYDEKGYLKDSLPELDYQGDTVTVLCWNSEHSEFEVEYGNNTVDNAIYKSNKSVEERLNITLSYEETRGDVKHTGDYKTKVTNAFNAGEYWDVIASYTRSTAICAAGGLLMNLGGLEGDNYLDFEKPWWSQDIIDKTSIGNTFYFCTGDISTNLIQMTYCMYFNAEMLSNMDIQSPYTYVENNQWTLETLQTICKNIYLDVNENDTADVGDRFGLVGAYYAYPAILHGCDVPILEKNSADSFVISESYKGQKAQRIMDDILAVMISDKSAFVDNALSTFTSGKTAFFITESGTGLNDLSTVTFEYGCVPCPKYDSSQTEYYSTVRQPVTLYGIMANLPKERIGTATATLECLASQRYRQTTPVIFEDCMKHLRSTSVEMTEMLQLIRDTAFFDCARIYSYETKYVCDKPGNCLQDGTKWANYVNGNMGQVEAAVNSLSSDLLSIAMQ